MRLFLGDSMSPEGININHGECRIFFMGDFNLHNITTIMD